MMLWLASFIMPCYKTIHKEHCASFDENLRPGDIFHPDFQCGHLAYFDVSVCSTTQPPPLLPLLGWLLQLERWLRMRSIWQWWRRQKVFHSVGCRMFWSMDTFCSVDCFIPCRPYDHPKCHGQQIDLVLV